jgi:hypothetical protein
MYRVACLTPEDECGGAVTEVNANLKGQGRPRKLHATHVEAFHCHVNYLMRTGHQRIGNREFRAPGGGILVLTKQTRYGAEFRMGKAPQGKGGRRFMPQCLHGDCPNGVIIPEPEKRKHIQALQAAVRNIKMLRQGRRRRS